MAPMSKYSMRRVAVSRDSMWSPAACACAASTCGSRRFRFSGSGPRKYSMSFERRGRPHVLGEVVAAGFQHPRDVAPVRLHRMAGGHQVEAGVVEGQRIIPGGLHDPDAAGPQQLPGALRIRRPGFGDHHRRWQLRGLVDHLSPAGVDVQRGVCSGQSARQQACISPGRTLLGGATVEEAESPPGDIGTLGFGNQLSKGPHQVIIAPGRPWRSRRAARRAPGDRAGLIDSWTQNPCRVRHRRAKLAGVTCCRHSHRPGHCDAPACARRWSATLVRQVPGPGRT